MTRRPFTLQTLRGLVLCAAVISGRPTSAGADEATPAHRAPHPETPAHPAERPTDAAAPQGSPTANAKSALAEEAAGYLKLGHSLTERSDYASAEIAFREVLKNPRAPVPAVKSALLGLAHMHRKQGAYTKAVAIYERYLKDYPDDDRVPDALLDLGRTLRAMGAHRTAIARFYSVINSTLKMPADGFEHYQLLAKTAQFEIAETHFATGDFAEAGKFFLRLRQLDLAPTDRARAHFKAAYAQNLNGEIENSITTLRTFLEKCEDDENVPEARHLLAVNLRKMKRSQEALAVTLDLLSTEKSRMRADPKRWIYWQRRTGNQLANDFFESGDTTNALAIYNGLLPLATEPQWRLPITYQTALCYERLGATELADRMYRSIIESAGAKPTPDLADLVRTATWRVEHLGWREKTRSQINTLFETQTGRITPPVALQAASLP
jgi:tetratricopeptide (TPR) repeat protein